MRRTESYTIYIDWWGHDSKSLRLLTRLPFFPISPSSLASLHPLKEKKKALQGSRDLEGKMTMDKRQQHKYYGAAPKPTRFAKHWCLLLISIFLFLNTRTLAFDYGDALRKSLLYFESQRSGRLPYNQRVTWRHHSGLTDGLEQGVSINLISLSRWVLHFSLLKIMKDVVCLILCRWIWSEDIMMQGTM